ncbi:MAG: hypothetical protein ILO42_07560 [Clostridia bacterium]|nr:hypothetical protein [Clostridia bacterium]
MNKPVKIVAALLSVLIVASLTSCAQGSAGREKRDVLGDCFKLFSELPAAKTSNPPTGMLDEEMKNAIRTTDYSAPLAVWRLEPDFSKIRQELLQVSESEDPDPLVEEFFVNTMKSGFFTYALFYFRPAPVDVSLLADSTLTNVSVSGYAPDLPEEEFRLYCYPDIWVAVTIRGDSSGHRSVSAQAVYFGELECDTEDDLWDYFGENSCVKSVKKLK